MRWNLSLAALASSWGLISVIGAYVKVDAAALAFARVSLGSLTIVLALAVAGRLHLLRLPRGKRVQVASTGAVLAGHWGLWFAAVKLSSVAVALVTIYTFPLYLSVLAPLLLGERRSRVALGALVPGLGGIALIALAGNGAGMHVRPAAVACGLTSGILYAVLIVGTKRATEGLASVTVQFWQCVTASFVLAPALAFGGRIVPHGVEIPLVLVLGIVYTGGSYLLFVALVSRVKAQVSGILMYLEPVSAALLAWLLLGQELRWPVVAGGLLVVLAGATVIVLEPPGAGPPAGVHRPRTVRRIQPRLAPEPDR